MIFDTCFMIHFARYGHKAHTLCLFANRSCSGQRDTPPDKPAASAES
jgi:hypothetical protein